MTHTLEQPGETVLAPTAMGLSRVYAQALADVLGDGESLAAGVAELEELVAMLMATDGAWAMLTDVSLSPASRETLVERVFGGRVSGAIGNVLGVLAKNGRLVLLPGIAQALRDVRNDRIGRVLLDVTTAYPLNDAETESLRVSLGEALGIDPILRLSVDRDLLAGLLVRCGDTVYDTTVAGQIRRLAEAMKVPRPAPRQETDQMPISTGSEEDE